MRPTARGKRLTFWILMMLLAVVLPLVATEIALRVIYREQGAAGTYWGLRAFEPDDVLGYRHAAGYRGHMSRSGVFDCLVETSRYGLRQSDVDLQLEYPRKVLLVGDSFTFGLGVAEESAFASLMKSRLNPEGVGVINAGQCGYSAEQEATFGIRLASLVEPDVIVLCLYLDNDVREDYTKGYANVEVRWGTRLSRDRRLPITVLDFLRTHSYLWMFVRRSLHTDRIEGQREPVRVSDFIRPTADAARRLHHGCQTRGISMGLVLIPPRSGGTVFDAPLKNVLAGDDIAILDLGETMAGGEGYFLTDGHWNERGHQRAADCLIPFVRSLLPQGAE